jgi:predicted ATPase
LSVAWRLPVDRLVVLAAELTIAVADWHQRNGPHRGLCPDVIDIDARDRVYLRPAGPPRPPYLAPEQTGWLRCAVDERCDLYAVGVLLYQLATGRLPNAGRDGSPVVDRRSDPRLVCRPERPGRLVSGLPETFDEIVVVLLAPLPHQRYQSARGLATDLRRCAELMAATGRIEPFLLAGLDVVAGLRRHGRCYGRDRALARLAAIAARVADSGQGELVVVTSEAGVGKTALVDAFADEVALSGGRVVGGRFRPSPAMPYAGLVDIVDDVAGRLAAAATQPPPDARLREALGGCAPALADLSPALAALCGSAPEDESDSPMAAEHRLRLAAARLLAAASGPGQPLVITLDDLDWADPASIGLLRHLLTTPNGRHLLVVATCRPGLPARHPVAELLARLRTGLPVTPLRLRPLPDSALTDWIADTLRANRGDAAKLARDVAARTGSVSLLAEQLMYRLVDRGELVFDPTGPRWRWRLDPAEAPISIGDLRSVVHERVQAMTTAGRALLLAATVLGDVDPHVAAKVTNLPAGQLTAALAETVRAGFLVATAAPPAAAAPAGNRYRWASERLRQILHSGLSSDHRGKLHGACGIALRTATAPTGPALSTVVDHFDHAGRPSPSAARRVEVAHLNLAAGRRAWRMGTVAAAHRYVHAAVALLPSSNRSGQRRLAYDTYALAARTEHARANPSGAQRLLALAGQHAADDLERASLLRIDAAAATHRGDRPAAFRSALAALDLLGLAPPTAEGADSFIHHLLQRLNNQRLLALAGTPPASDTRIRLAGQIATDTLFPLDAADEPATLLAAVGVGLCLDHGPTTTAAVAFACLAANLAQRPGTDKTAERCWNTTLRLLGDTPSPALASRTLPAVAFVHAAWLRQPDAALDRLHEAYLAAVEQGELDQADALHALHCAHRFLSGAPLDSIANQLAAAPHCDDGAHAHHPDHTGFPARAVRDCLRSVIERLPAGAHTADGAAESPPTVEHGYAATLCTTIELVAACVTGDLRRAGALAAALTAAPPSSFAAAEACFYRALAIAMTTPTPATGQPAPAVTALEAAQPVLDHWAAQAPGLYAAKAQLISAERARLTGDDTTAEHRFDQAIEAARNHDCGRIEALAAQRAAAHAEHRGHSEPALAYQHQAHACRQRWSTPGTPQQPLPGVATDSPTQPGSAVDQLDLHSLRHAFQTLSADLGVDELLDAIAEQLLRHTGADRICLLTGDDLRLTVVATATPGGGVHTVPRHSLSQQLETQVPLSVVGQVRSTHQTVIADRTSLPELPRDPYLLRQRPATLMCTPLTRNGRLLAVAYLEYHQQPPTGPPSYRHTLPLLCLHAATLLDGATTTRRLSQATEILDATVERLPVGLILLDPDLTVHRASPHARELTRLPIRPGMPIAELFDVLTPADTRPSSFALELALMAAGGDSAEPIRQSLTLVQPDGPRVQLSAHAYPLRRPDHSVFCIALLLEGADTNISQP